MVAGLTGHWAFDSFSRRTLSGMLFGALFSLFCLAYLQHAVKQFRSISGLDTEELVVGEEPAAGYEGGAVG